MRVLPAVVVAAMIWFAGCACRGDHGKVVGSATANATPTTEPIATAKSSHGGDGAIRVESARYGRDDEWTDVTPQVRALINGDTIVFPRDLHKTFNVDPVPGRMKYVDMTLIVDGRVMEMRLGDSLHLTPLRLRAGTGGSAAGRE